MTAGFGRGLGLAGIGAAIGLAVVAALFGTEDLLKRIRGAAAPTQTERPLAGLPKDGDKAGASPTADKPRPESGDRAAVDSNQGSLAGPGNVPQGETPQGGSEPGDARQAGAPATPSLDILRVEPSGDAVLAGRGAPKASVELLRDNKTVARATADESGQFAIDSLVLPPGNSELTLRSTTPDGRTTEGKASAVVVVDKDRKAQPLVAVSEADKPTRVLSMPSQPKTAEAPAKVSGGESANPSAKDANPRAAKAAGQDPDKTSARTAGGTTMEKSAVPPRREAALPGADSKSGAAEAETKPVRIVSVDAQEGGRLFVSGQGASWTSLRLYLNDTMVASGRSGADGRIAFTIGRGVKPGGYQIRIDQVDEASGKVGQRAQVGFTFPPQLAAKEPTRQPTREAVKEPAPPQARLAARETPVGPAKPEIGSVDKPDQPSAPPVSKPAVAAAPSATSEARPNAAASPDADKRMAEAPSPRGPNAERQVGTEPGSIKAPVTDDGPNRAALAEGLPAPQRSGGTTIAPPATPDSQAATVFVPEIDTTRITRGDNLWQISRRSYGDGKRYTVIYEANREQIRDPNLIYPGQIFVMPKDQGPTSDGQGARRG